MFIKHEQVSCHYRTACLRIKLRTAHQQEFCENKMWAGEYRTVTMNVSTASLDSFAQLKLLFEIGNKIQSTKSLNILIWTLHAAFRIKFAIKLSFVPAFVI